MRLLFTISTLLSLFTLHVHAGGTSIGSPGFMEETSKSPGDFYYVRKKTKLREDLQEVSINDPFFQKAMIEYKKILKFLERRDSDFKVLPSFEKKRFYKVGEKTDKKKTVRTFLTNRLSGKAPSFSIEKGKKAKMISYTYPVEILDENFARVPDGKFEVIELLEPDFSDMTTPPGYFLSQTPETRKSIAQAFQLMHEFLHIYSSKRGNLEVISSFMKSLMLTYSAYLQQQAELGKDQMPSPVSEEVGQASIRLYHLMLLISEPKRVPSKRPYHEDYQFVSYSHQGGGIVSSTTKSGLNAARNIYVGLTSRVLWDGEVKGRIKFSDNYIVKSRVSVSANIKLNEEFHFINNQVISSKLYIRRPEEESGNKESKSELYIKNNQLTKSTLSIHWKDEGSSNKVFFRGNSLEETHLNVKLEYPKQEKSGVYFETNTFYKSPKIEILIEGSEENVYFNSNIFAAAYIHGFKISSNNSNVSCSQNKFIYLEVDQLECLGEKNIIYKVLPDPHFNYETPNGETGRNVIDLTVLGYNNYIDDIKYPFPESNNLLLKIDGSRNHLKDVTFKARYSSRYDRIKEKNHYIVKESYEYEFHINNDRYSKERTYNIHVGSDILMSKATFIQKNEELGGMELIIKDKSIFEKNSTLTTPGSKVVLGPNVLVSNSTLRNVVLSPDMELKDLKLKNCDFINKQKTDRALWQYVTGDNFHETCQ